MHEYEKEMPLALEFLLSQVSHGGCVADIGCFGWLLSEPCGKRGLKLVGIDRSEPPGKGPGDFFAKMDGSKLFMEDSSCDLVVASHVVEHLEDPVGLADECFRILKPGGLLVVEAPSELSCLGISSDNPEDHAFNSFWDDPTHLRPHTPGSLLCIG